jgi:hypothetical protein
MKESKEMVELFLRDRTISLNIKVEKCPSRIFEVKSQVPPRARNVTLGRRKFGWVHLKESI